MRHLLRKWSRLECSLGRCCGICPLTCAMLLIARGTVWVFLRVAVFGLLFWPTAAMPNAKVEGAKLVWAKASEPRRRRDKRDQTAPRKSFGR